MTLGREEDACSFGEWFRGNAAGNAFPLMAFSAFYTFKHFSNLFQNLFKNSR